MTTQTESEWIEEAMHLVEQYAKTIIVTMHVSSVVRHKKNTAALDAIRAHLATRPQVPEADGCHGLDTPERVRFYEHDFYVLSNFSAFRMQWGGMRHQTSEHLYHYMKFARPWADEERDEPIDFNGPEVLIAQAIYSAPSAHEAFKIAERNKDKRRPDWDQIKVSVMRDIIRAKAMQHEYVRRKLLATGDRELVEDSWRDDFWGWGPNRDGKNMLGKLWMEVRAELRATALAGEGE